MSPGRLVLVFLVLLGFAPLVLPEFWITDDDVLGGIQLQLIDPENANAEIGYGLLPHARGRGYTVEALRKVTEWSFGTLALERIGLMHAVENEASCRVAEQAGYRKEGTLRSSHRFGDDRLHDEHVHARLRVDS